MPPARRETPAAALCVSVCVRARARERWKRDARPGGKKWDQWDQLERSGTNGTNGTNGMFFPFAWPFGGWDFHSHSTCREERVGWDDDGMMIWSSGSIHFIIASTLSLSLSLSLSPSLPLSPGHGHGQGHVLGRESDPVSKCSVLPPAAQILPSPSRVKFGLTYLPISLVSCLLVAYVCTYLCTLPAYISTYICSPSYPCYNVCTYVLVHTT
jgi:hypothetical protein